MTLEEIIWTVIGISLFVALLYFGYRDDYRRGPKKFWRTIFGVFGSFISHGVGGPMIRLPEGEEETKQKGGSSDPSASN